MLWLHHSVPINKNESIEIKNNNENVDFYSFLLLTHQKDVTGDMLCPIILSERKVGVSQCS